MLGHNIGFELSGRTAKKGSWKLDASYAHRFEGPAPKPSRAVWIFGYHRQSIGWSVMLQIYRPGMDLDWHQDGYNIHNFVKSFILWQPKKGGVLEKTGLPYVQNK